MAELTVHKLIDLIKRCDLIEPTRLTAFLDEVAAKNGGQLPEDEQRLAADFIAADLLTKWQADKLLAGKHKGFRLGKYKLLGQIGKGGMSSVYLAEHTMMRRRVAIKVLP
ncbi:MAG: serine/threonine protein kinase, partial [Planctomycetota bacterium]